MEKDRFEQHKIIYVISMICLLVGIVLIALSVYVMPYLLWEWNSTIPSSILYWQVELQQIYNYTKTNSALYIFIHLFLVGLVLVLIASIITNYIDKQLFRKELQNPSDIDRANKESERSIEVIESLSYTSKLLMILIIALVILFSIEWLISVPAPI